MRFSLLVHVAPDTNPVLFGDMIRSVIEQRLSSWELVLAMDARVRASLPPSTQRTLRGDHRIRVVAVDSAASYADALQAAYETSSGEFVGIIDPEDLLARTALSSIEQQITVDPAVDCWYTDEDFVDDTGIYYRAFYKPDWSPERLRSQPYVGSLFISRRTVLEALTGAIAGAGPFGGLEPAAEAYDLTLRVTERASRIGHVARALYHRRCSAGGQLAAPNDDAGKRAVGAHLRRMAITAEIVTDYSTHTHRVVRALDGAPLISLIIPTRGSTGRVWGTDRVFVTEAVRSVVDRCTYRNFELVVVFDDDTPTAVLDELTSIGGDYLRLVPFHRPFNFSEKINVGRANATGSLLLLFNDDIEVIAADFLETMAVLAMEPDVGAVGAKLLLSDGRLQHGGHVYCGEPHHIMWGRWRDDPGPFALMAVQRECIGVTAACLMTRAEVFDALGGFPTVFPIDFNDVDFALKLHQRGFRSIWAPAAELYHFETQTREKVSKPADVAMMYDLWQHELDHDPYFNPNLAPHRDDWVEIGLR